MQNFSTSFEKAAASDDEVRVQSTEKRLVRSLVKFVPALLACLFCLALLGTCLVESAYLISEPCTLAHVMTLSEVRARPPHKNVHTTRTRT